MTTSASFSLPSGSNGLPRLESLIRVDANLTLGTLDGNTVTIPAGEYVLSSEWDGADPFLDVLADALNTASSTTDYSATVDAATDNATGKVTIASAGAAFTLNWDAGAAELEALLGFAANLTGATAYTAANHCRALWLPNCGRSELLAAPTTSTSRYGKPESDASFAKSPSGYTRRMSWSKRYADSMQFNHIQGNKAWKAHEVIVNESFETWWDYGIGIGRAFRYYGNRADVTTYQSWVVENFGECAIRFTNPNWVGPVATNVVGPYQLAKYLATP